MLSKNHIFLVAAMFGTLIVAAQDTNRMIQSANELYKKQDYEKAEAAYDKVLEKDGHNTTAKFNLANTYFRRSKKDDAAKAFDYLTSDGQPPELREKSYYNKGVVLSRQEKLEASIEAYKDALRLNPSDTLARENLQKALFELKKKQPPPKKEEEPKKKKQQEQKKQNQQQSKMNQKEAEDRLKMMEQKEKEVLQRMQAEKSKSGNTVAKDW